MPPTTRWITSKRRRQPAIDGDLLARDVGPGFRGEQNRKPRELAGFAPASQCRPAVDELDEFLVLEQRSRELRLEIARRDGIAGDAVLPELGRERPGDAGQRAFRRHVAVNGCAAAPGRDRGRENDAAVALQA